MTGAGVQNDANGDMGRLDVHGRSAPGAIPCQVILPGSGAANELRAEAVRLDRQGGVLHIVTAGALPELKEQAEVLVSFDLPGALLAEPRRLCFRAGVRHVSSALAPHHWIGVSFQEAAICSFGQCCPRL